MRRRSGRRRIGLAIGVLGMGALVVFLLRQSRGTAGEQIEKASEAARSRAQEYLGSSEGDAEPQEETERPADREKGSAEEPEEEPGGTTGERARASEERLEEEGDTEGTREELQRIVRESVRRSEKPSADRRGESVGEAGERTERAGSEESSGEQVTVIGLLAKMREAFQETGGGQFILSSEEEGNFDLHGKEDELDDVYQQQIQARVVGRIVDGDSQPRKMEVDEVEPA